MSSRRPEKDSSAGIAGEASLIPEALFLQWGFYLSLDTSEYAEVTSREKLPLDALDYLAHLLEKPVYQKEVSAERVDRHFRDFLFKGRSQSDLISASMGGAAVGTSRERLEVKYSDAPIVKLVNSLLEEAIKRGASDVHIEPYESEMVTRFRINGKLIKTLKNPPDYFEAVSSRVKYLARLDITQKMLPQDGKAQVEVGGASLDLRVSTIPTKVGESVVIRILRKNVEYLDLDKLGLSPKVVVRINSLMSRLSGLILATGPTGSGKSTTLYAMLKKIHNREIKILTIEDPVEYQMEGVNQVEVNPAQGITFANILRHALRHDPDVIMVGEIRDEETARMAIQASLTGHLVLSTLHTGDSVSAITRLLDLGIEPYLVSSSLRAIIAQRLVRRLCPHCKGTPKAEKASKARSNKKAAFKESTPKDGGCTHCDGSGFIDRTAIMEYLEVDKKLQEFITGDQPEQRIKEHLRKTGFQFLEDEAMAMVKRGETTSEEIEPHLGAR